MRFETHTHTEFSNKRLLDSTNKIDKLLLKANEMGLSGLTITDHESLASAPRLFRLEKELKEKGELPKEFKVALGNEIYLVEDRENIERYFHFILIAKSLKGYHALSILSSLANLQGWKTGKMERVPTTIKELKGVMEDYKGEVIACTACLGGYMQNRALSLSKASKAKDKELESKVKQEMIDFTNEMVSIFGDDFYIELSPAETEEQIVVNQILLNFADFKGLKCIIGSDAHYLRPENRRAHSAFLNSNKGKDRETDKFYRYAYLQTDNEIKQNLFNVCNEDRVEEFFRNSLSLAEKIGEYSISKAPIIPEFNDIKIFDIGNYPNVQQKTLRKYLDSENIQKRYWVNSCLDSLYEKKLESDVTLDRLETEADILEYLSEKSDVTIASYFNTFKEVVDIFWDAESIMPPGRGSASGFLSCYLLDIVQVNPLQYDLQHWRFLNKERVELPKQLLGN